MKIAVTRPMPEALATAERVRAMGHEALVVPLTEIVGLDPGAVEVDKIGLVVATSANAIRFAKAPLLRRISALPMLTVGDRTAACAVQSGFADVTSAGGDVTELLPLTLSRTRPGSVVLYLCGKPRRPDFEAGMEQAGSRVVIAETYENRPVVLDEDAMKVLQSADAILLHARSTADIIATIGPRLGEMTAICMSQRVAEPLKSLNRRLVVAARPTETAILAAINRL